MGLRVIVQRAARFSRPPPDIPRSRPVGSFRGGAGDLWGRRPRRAVGGLDSAASLGAVPGLQPLGAAAQSRYARRKRPALDLRQSFSRRRHLARAKSQHVPLKIYRRARGRKE